MKIEINTDSYNEKRYGKPWLAKVIFIDTQTEFKFGNWIGDAGCSGRLVLDNVCEGDIIARGQKDNRGKNNDIYYYIVKNGLLEKSSKLLAYDFYCSLIKEVTNKELDRFSTDEALTEIPKSSVTMGDLFSGPMTMDDLFSEIENIKNLDKPDNFNIKIEFDLRYRLDIKDYRDFRMSYVIKYGDECCIDYRLWPVIQFLRKLQEKEE
jgi:hypothetical protein